MISTDHAAACLHRAHPFHLVAVLCGVLKSTRWVSALRSCFSAECFFKIVFKALEAQTSQTLKWLREAGAERRLDEGWEPPSRRSAVLLATTTPRDWTVMTSLCKHLQVLTGLVTLTFPLEPPGQPLRLTVQ